MAELSPRDRLQPFLLDRLTDDEPHVTQESRERRVFSPRQVQASILRDLGWLLNAKAPRPEDGLGEFPEVSKSVLNYGIPELSGSSAASLDVFRVETMLTQALLNFEPRLVPRTLAVHLRADDAIPGNIVGFEIKGEIAANPLPDPLFIQTELDLETGQYVLKDRAHG